MSKTLVIAAHELRDKKRIFVVAAAFAVLPFLTALLPAARNDRGTIIAAVSGFVAAGVGLGVAVMLGLTTIGGQLAAGRLSFYFSKPVSAASIWFGKVAAALIISLASLLIITLPSYLTAREAWELMWVRTGRGLPWIVAIGAIVLFLVSHAIGTMARSRSPLFALDFTLAAIATFALVLILRPIAVGGAGKLLSAVAIALGSALVLVLAIAPVWQLMNGRTDARSNHRALSKALWLSFGVVLAIGAAYTIWLTTPSPHDVPQILRMEQSPASDRIMLTGGSPRRGDYYASFIIDTKTGDGDRLPAPPFWGVPQFSRDGRVVVWISPAGFEWGGRDLELYARRLDQPGAQDVATGIRVRPMTAFMISPGGERVAVAMGNLVSVYDLTTRKLLASASGFEEWTVRSMYFLSPDLLRIVRTGDGNESLKISELDVAKRSIARTGEIIAMDPGSMSAAADGSRMLLRKARLVVDGRTGATIYAIPAEGRIVSSVMLHDGRVALVQPDGQRVRLRVLGLDGRTVSDVALPAPEAWVGAEVGDGKVLVLGFDRKSGGPAHEGRTMFVVDAAKQAIVQTSANVRVPTWPWWRMDPRGARFREGQLLAGFDGRGKIVLWDPGTGAVKPLL